MKIPKRTEFSDQVEYLLSFIILLLMMYFVDALEGLLQPFLHLFN